MLWIVPAGTFLTVKDFREVYEQLYPQRLKWRPIGVRLGLQCDLLENIEDQYRKNEKRLEQTLMEWLRRRHLNPTWQSLIDALRHRTVGDEGAAEDLEEYVMSGAEGG